MGKISKFRFRYRNELVITVLAENWEQAMNRVQTGSWHKAELCASGLWMVLLVPVDEDWEEVESEEG